MIEPNQIRRRGSRGACAGFVKVLAIAALAMAPALPSFAEGAADAPAEEAAAESAGPEYVPCSELGRLKYPFLRCVRGPSGRPVIAAEGPGMTGAQLKLGSSFAAGAGGWGASGIE